MKKYGTESQSERDVEWREFAKEVVINTIIVVLIFAAGVLFVCSLGCTLNLNVGGEGQPGQVVYQHPEDSVME
jgi:hypothetical protein